MNDVPADECFRCAFLSDELSVAYLPHVTRRRPGPVEEVGVGLFSFIHLQYV